MYKIKLKLLNGFLAESTKLGLGQMLLFEKNIVPTVT